MVQKYQYGKNVYTKEDLITALKKRYGDNYMIKFDQVASRHVIETFQRTCLKCSRGFEARGRYVRVCGKCKVTEEWIAGDIDLL